MSTRGFYRALVVFGSLPKPVKSLRWPKWSLYLRYMSCHLDAPLFLYWWPMSSQLSWTFLFPTSRHLRTSFLLFLLFLCSFDPGGPLVFKNRFIHVISKASGAVHSWQSLVLKPGIHAVCCVFISSTVELLGHLSWPHIHASVASLGLWIRWLLNV